MRIIIDQEDKSNIAIPVYEGHISMLRQDSCGFISDHNVPGFMDKDIYFSYKVLLDLSVIQGDRVMFNVGKSLDKIWALNVQKLE